MTEANEFGDVFDEHLRAEFEAHDPAATMSNALIPGVAPTGKQVALPVVVVVKFRDGKVAHEHIYWDPACLLEQIGLLDRAALPITGIEQALNLLDRSYATNALLARVT